MSYTAAETGRVKSIKSKFENLNSLESLDISATVPHKYRKPSPSFLFKRSSTSIDLPAHRSIANVTSSSNNNNNNNNNNKFKRISPPKQPPPPRPTSSASSIIEPKHKTVSNVNAKQTENTTKSPSFGYLRRHNNLDRTVSADAFVIKKRNFAANDEDTLKPLKEIKENVEVRLMRHTNDPVKRSSIKRSPAFRVGDKGNCNNSNGVKNGNNSNGNAKSVNGTASTTTTSTKGTIKSNRTATTNTAAATPTPVTSTTTTTTTTNNGVPVISPEFAEKFENLLKRCDIETRQQLDEPGLTDTLKAVLRQPLPSGPPPKKPPRTFIDSPKSTTITVQRSETSPTHSSDDEKLAKARNHLPATVSTASADKMRQKIDLLENQLVLKTSNKAKGTTRNAVKHPFNSSLLNCIPCSSASIYDTMIIGPNQFGKVITSKEPTSPEKMPPTTTTTAATTIGKTNRNVQRASNTEPIYMEPFAHLKYTGKIGNGTTAATSTPSQKCNSFGVAVASPTTPSHSSNEPKPLSSSLSNTSFDGPESLGSSLTSCTSCTADDHSINDLHDIHYMCTSIENKIKSSDSDSTSNENDQPLPNTYDEINILVNAAFEQHKVNDGMGNANDSMQVSPSISHSSSPLSNEAVNQEKTTIKLSRRLTEKRKEYVKKVSVQRIQPDSLLSNDSMHQTFKSAVFRTFSIDNTDNEMAHNDSINSNSGSKHVSPKSVRGGGEDRNGNITDGRKSDNDNDNEIDDVDGDGGIQFGDNAPKLFQVCLLIGFNNSTRQAYIKSKFPADEEIPLNIEQLVFPSPNLINQTRKNQDYSIILTDGNGYHVYGYCRRILPESCEICLPLAYCIISEVKAPGFYFKILREIETRHGQAEFQTNFLLQSLQTRSIPAAGKFLHVKLPLSPRPKTISTSHHKVTPKRLSLEVNPRWLTESAAQAAFSNCETDSTATATTKKERSNQAKSLVQEFEEKKQNGAPFDLSLINRSLFNGKNKCDEIFIRRPNDLRLESTELSDLYQALGSDLLIVVFSTLLLERKVILCTENISILSSCVLGLQTLLYPFQWQHTIITILPESLVDICEAPIPVLAGLLKPIDFKIEDAIVIDLNTKTLLQKCGDETTILPPSLSHSLKVSLEMVDLLDQGKMLSSVLIAEAFLRCFVELFVGYKHKTFNKVEFIASHSSQSYRLFLEWFVETAMFRHFVQQKFSEPDPVNGPNTASWMAESNFYDLFDSRILKNENESSSMQQKNMEIIMKNCKVINKTKTKTFKDRFKDFISSGSSN